jgi:hypothetical protein
MKTKNTPKSLWELGVFLLLGFESYVESASCLFMVTFQTTPQTDHI